MATKFVAPVIASALLVIASSVAKLPGEKKLVVSTEKPASAYVWRRRIVALDTQMAREAEHIHSVYLVSLPSTCTKSCAMSNFEKQRIVARKVSSFCNYVPQINGELQRRLCIGPSFDHM